jgi:predicted MFS family arabinose efflux permease
MVPPATHVIHTFGWRWVFITLALLVLAVNLLVALTLMAPPEPLTDSRLDGLTTETAISESAKRDLSLGMAMRTPSFWWFTVLMAICGGGDYLIITHLVPMVTDMGISPATAGSMMAWFGLLAMAGLLVTGPLVDRFGNKLPTVATFVLRLAIFILILFFQNAVAFYIFTLIFGFTMLITAPITTTLPAKLYGLSHIGLISGAITTVHHFSGGLWAYLGGVAFDRTGNYDLIFVVYAGFSAMAILCGLLIKEKKHHIGWTTTPQ